MPACDATRPRGALSFTGPQEFNALPTLQSVLETSGWEPVSGVRTAGLPFTRSTAACTDGASCTDDTGNRTDGTRRAGIIRSAGPRTGPRLTTTIAQCQLLSVTVRRARSRLRAGGDRRHGHGERTDWVVRMRRESVVEVDDVGRCSGRATGGRCGPRGMLHAARSPAALAFLAGLAARDYRGRSPSALRCAAHATVFELVSPGRMGVGQGSPRLCRARVGRRRLLRPVSGPGR
jgi:hypothetical protein